MEEKEKSKEYDNSRTVCPWAEVILNAKIIAVTKTRLLLTILRGKSVKKEWNIIHPPWPVWIGLNYNLFSLVFSLHFSTTDDTRAFFSLSFPTSILSALFPNSCLLFPFCVDPRSHAFQNSCLSYIFFIIRRNEHIVFRWKLKHNNMETITVSYSSLSLSFSSL